MATCQSPSKKDLLSVKHCCLYRIGIYGGNHEVILMNDRQNFTLGRSEENDIVLEESLSISRRHAVLNRMGSEWTIMDLASSNGVFVNYRRIPPRIPTNLQDRDIIEIGKDPAGKTPVAYTFQYYKAAKLEVSSSVKPVISRVCQEDEPSATLSPSTKFKIKIAEQERILRREMEQKIAEQERLLRKEMEEKEKIAEQERLLRKEMEEKEKIIDHERLLKKEMEEKEKIAEKERLLRKEIEEKQQEAEGRLHRMQELLSGKEEILCQFQEKLKEKDEAMKTVEAEIHHASKLQKELETRLQREKQELEERLRQKEIEEVMLVQVKHEVTEELKRAQEEAEQERQRLEKEHFLAVQQAQKEAQEKMESMAEILAAKTLVEEMMDNERVKLIKEKENMKSEVEKLQKSLRESEGVLKEQLEELQAEKLKVEKDLSESLNKRLEQKDKEHELNLREQQDILRHKQEELVLKLNKKEEEQLQLQQQLNKMAIEVEKEKSCREVEKKEVQNNIEDILESELVCSICSELFIQSVSLQCSHSFCLLCIEKWIKQSNKCPICRTFIISKVRSIVLDNYIDRIVAILSEELRESRKQIVAERKEELKRFNEQNQSRWGPRPVAHAQGAQVPSPATIRLIGQYVGPETAQHSAHAHVAYRQDRHVQTQGAQPYQGYNTQMRNPNARYNRPMNGMNSRWR